jgi:acyl carrier protein
MKKQKEVLDIIKEIMEEMFEIESELITPNARLNEDLDLDSIDAVDMIVKLKEITGKDVRPEDFKNTRTIQDVMASVSKLIDD